MKLYMARHAGTPMLYAEDGKAFWYQANRQAVTGVLDKLLAWRVVRESTLAELNHNRRDLYLKAVNPSRPYTVMAEKYGVSEGTIRHVNYGRTWRHITGATSENPVRRRSHLDTGAGKRTVGTGAAPDEAFR